MATTLVIALCGVVFGIVSAILPLGPVTLLVLRRALAGDPAGALWIGLGRVPVEACYCGLATFGIVALLDRVRAVHNTIELLGTLVFLVVGVWLLLQTSAPGAVSADVPMAADTRTRRWGNAAGLIISILNPTYLLSWSAIVAVAVSLAHLEPTLLDKIAFPLALAVGIAIGYVLLLEYLRRHEAQMARAWVLIAIRGMGGVLVALALWNLVVRLNTR